MKKNKKIVIATTSILLLAIYLYKKDDQIKTEFDHTAKRDTKMKKSDIKRSPSSIKSLPNKASNKKAKKEIGQSKNNKAIRSLKDINPKLLRMFKEQNKVLTIKEVLVNRRLPHTNKTEVTVMTNYNNQNNSFKALIDNETGIILQTWAQKQSENLLGKDHKNLVHPLFK